MAGIVDATRPGRCDPRDVAVDRAIADLEHELGRFDLTARIAVMRVLERFGRTCSSQDCDHPCCPRFDDE